MKWWIATLALLALGFLLQLGLLVYAMYVLLAVLWLSRHLAARWIDSAVVSRHGLLESAEIGSSIAVTVTVKNTGRWPIPWMIIEDSIPRSALLEQPPRLRVTGPSLGLFRVRPTQPATLAYSVHFLRRGYYQLGPVLVETGDLFGLHRRFRMEGQPHFVLVRPRVVPLEGYSLASRRPLGEIRLTHRLFEDPTRISGIRPYQQGDSLSRVHWRATARTGTLHSKTFDASTVAGATVLLDFRRDSYSSNALIHRSELAITTVASLAHALAQVNQPFGLVTNGRDAAERIRTEGWRAEFATRSEAHQRLDPPTNAPEQLQPVIIPPARGPAQFERVADLLARLELSDGLDFPALVLESSGRISRHATVIALVTHVSPETAIALGTLRRRGFAVTVVRLVFDERESPAWAKKPDWAGWLLAAGIDIRHVGSDEAIASLCAAQFLPA